MHTRHTLVVLALAGSGLVTTGCELLPGLLGGGGGTPIDSTTASLEVTIERADGTLEGAPLEASTLVGTGSRFGTSLQLELMVPETGAMIFISTPGTDSSTENPYGGGGFGAEGPRPLPDDAGFAPEPNAPSVMVCRFDCRAPTDFELQMTQLEEGRAVQLDGTWESGEAVHVQLHYRERR